MQVAVCLPGFFLCAWLLVSLRKFLGVQSGEIGINNCQISALLAVFSLLNVTSWLGVLLCNLVAEHTKILLTFSYTYEVIASIGFGTYTWVIYNLISLQLQH